VSDNGFVVPKSVANDLGAQAAATTTLTVATGFASKVDFGGNEFRV